jgi:hypothetical protein
MSLSFANHAAAAAAAACDLIPLSIRCKRKAHNIDNVSIFLFLFYLNEKLSSKQTASRGQISRRKTRTINDTKR